MHTWCLKFDHSKDALEWLHSYEICSLDSADNQHPEPVGIRIRHEANQGEYSILTAGTQRMATLQAPTPCTNFRVAHRSAIPTAQNHTSTATAFTAVVIKVRDKGYDSESSQYSCCRRINDVKLYQLADKHE